MSQVLHCPYCQGIDMYDMGRPRKASNGTAAASAQIKAVPFS
jgi:hypothetical protein